MKAKFNPNQLDLFEYAAGEEAKRAIAEAARLQAEKETVKAETRETVAEEHVMPVLEDDADEMLSWYEENVACESVTEDELCGRNWYSTGLIC